MLNFLKLIFFLIVSLFLFCFIPQVENWLVNELKKKNITRIISIILLKKGPLSIKSKHFVFEPAFLIENCFYEQVVLGCRYKASCLHLGSGPAGEVPSIGGLCKGS